MMLGVLLIFFSVLAYFQMDKFHFSLNSNFGSAIHGANSLTPNHEELIIVKKTKAVSLKLKSYAGDVATIKLLIVKDEDGNKLLQKFVENTHCSTFQLEVPKKSTQLTVKYGDAEKLVELEDGIGEMELTSHKS